jgi:hypothetical protein
MEKFSDLIERCATGPLGEEVPTKKSFTVKVSREAHLRMQCIAAHVGIKITPLSAQILEAAINELFDAVSDDFEPGLTCHYQEKMEELQHV